MDKITRKVMEQYVAVRQAGICNMFDLNCVQSVAAQCGFDALANLDRKAYETLLENFSSLMKKYGIQRGG